MKKNTKKTKFKDENSERKFWSDFDLNEKFQPKDFKNVSFPNLKPTTRSISLRIPEHLLVRVKERANKLSIPYQTLLKQYISQGAQKK